MCYTTVSYCLLQGRGFFRSTGQSEHKCHSSLKHSDFKWGEKRLVSAGLSLDRKKESYTDVR